MNHALQIWRQAFLQRPTDEFDRLVRGLVPLGTANLLSLGELFEGVFEPGDDSLDAAAKQWLESYILQSLPEGAGPERWSAILDEFLRGIAPLRLRQMSELLRTKHTLIRTWLKGLYQGDSRDPESSYLLALACNQTDQEFSPLWRRLVLANEIRGQSYEDSNLLRDIGLLGFRKLPDSKGNPASDIPEGLMRVIVDLAEQPATTEDQWKQIVQSIFALYRRSEGYWILRFKSSLAIYSERRKADEWLTHLLPRWQHQTQTA